MLIDSNIIIYASKPEHRALRRLIATQSPAVSVVSYVEVLGYHRLLERERRLFEDFFVAAPMLQISVEILECSTSLRQKKAVSLGDALIAATALVHDLELITANTADFDWIPDLRVTNPLS